MRAFGLLTAVLIVAMCVLRVALSMVQAEESRVPDYSVLVQQQN